MIHIREMDESHIDAVSALRVRSWQSAYRGIIPQSHLDGMTAAEDARRRRAWFASSRDQVVDLVAVDGHGDTVSGWICFGSYRGETDAQAPGEVYALYVDPARTGRGIGRDLLDSAHHHAAA
ncbi:GNAT family N-acetyltransferase, partial [Streptomyces jumonjinensis]